MGNDGSNRELYGAVDFDDDDQNDDDDDLKPGWAMITMIISMMTTILKTMT